MKVVMVGPYPEPGSRIGGGVERVIASLMPHLKNRVDLTLVVPGALSDATTSVSGVEVHYLKRSIGPGVIRSWSLDALKLAKFMDSLDPDIVHLQGGGAVGRFLKWPKVLTIHGIAHKDLLLSRQGEGWSKKIRMLGANLLQRSERNARRKVDGVFVINPYVREALPDVELLKQWDIPNPLDSSFISSHGPVEHRSKKLISVGRISPLKNTKKIIEIALGVMEQDPEVTLVICGAPMPSEYGELCYQLVREHPLGERVKFLGNLETGELVKQLDQASVLLMASSQENAPMAIAEANARGVAVVAPEGFGIKYMIKPFANGLFLPVTNIQDQVQTVLAALDLRWRRGEIAKVATTVFAPEQISNTIVTAYNEILKSKKR